MAATSFQVGKQGFWAGERKRPRGWGGRSDGLNTVSVDQDTNIMLYISPPMWSHPGRTCSFRYGRVRMTVLVRVDDPWSEIDVYLYVPDDSC